MNWWSEVKTSGRAPPLWTLCIWRWSPLGPGSINTCFCHVLCHPDAQEFKAKHHLYVSFTWREQTMKRMFQQSLLQKPKVPKNMYVRTRLIQLCCRTNVQEKTIDVGFLPVETYIGPMKSFISAGVTSRSKWGKIWRHDVTGLVTTVGTHSRNLHFAHRPTLWESQTFHFEDSFHSGLFRVY